MAVARTLLLVIGNLAWVVVVMVAANRRFAPQLTRAGDGREQTAMLFPSQRTYRLWEEAVVIVLTPGLAVGASLEFRSAWVAALIATFLGLSVVIALGDLRWRIIPNIVIYPAYILYGVAVLGLWVAGAGVKPAIAPLGMIAYGGGLFLLALLWPGGMGMGDVKLAGLTGLVLGALGWAYVAVAAAAAILIGGLGGVVLLAMGAGRKTRIPFAPYLALGAMVAAFSAHRIARWYLARLA